MTPTRLRLLLTATTLVAACGGGTPAPDVTTDRVAALQDVRDAVGPVAVELGTAAAEVTAAVSRLREDSTVTEATSTAAARLAAAVDAADAVAGDVGDAFPDVTSALADAAESARVLADAAADAADGLAVAESRRRELARLVDRWDDDASRREQLERLEGVAAELRALADATSAAPPACAAAERSWLAAAVDAAEVTDELRGHVQATDGLRFDELRASARERLMPDEPLAASAATCAALGDVDAAAERTTRALTGVQDALNPDGLVEP